MKPRIAFPRKAWAPLAVLAAFLVGWYFGLPPDTSKSHDHDGADTIWTCSMHPQIRQPEPGLCPICAMDLIPLESGAAGGLREVSVSAEAAALMDLRVSPVVRRPATVHVDFFGKIAYDERRNTTTTARIGGRLDRFYIDYTGTQVRQGDHIAEIYSPDLVVAQQELIQAAQGLERSRQSGTPAAVRTQERLVRSSRERLRLLQLTDTQIDAIAEQKEPSDHVTLFAPQDGVVTKRHVVEGAYVKEGEALFSVAALDSVWLNLEAYESDLPWLKFAQDVAFTVEALPGEVFHGRVAYIDPEIDPLRRVVRVRVNVPNERRLLKPGMFVRATIDAEVTADGRVIDPGLAGKWISPMHPEVVSDRPGQCTICGMDLVPAEELGFIRSGGDKDHADPLLVPASAVLQTGRRATVYVRISGESSPRFEGREIVVGPRVGNHFVVDSGLTEGEWVVTRGAFKLDSELQIQARPSMMNRNAGLLETPAHEAPPALLAQWGPVSRNLTRMESAASAGDSEGFRRAHAAIQSALEQIDPQTFDDETAARWREFSTRLENALSAGDDTRSENVLAAYQTIRLAIEETARYLGLPLETLGAGKGRETEADPARVAALRGALQTYYAFTGALAEDDLPAARAASSKLSEALENVGLASSGIAPTASLDQLREALQPVTQELIDAIDMAAADSVGNAYVVHCPMAFDNQGADWLSPAPEIANPYFGDSMLRCGSVTANLSFDPAAESDSQPTPNSP